MGISFLFASSPRKKAYYLYFMLSSTFQKKSNIVMPMKQYYDTF